MKLGLYYQNNLYIIVICKGSSQFPFMQITYIDVAYYK